MKTNKNDNSSDGQKSEQEESAADRLLDEISRNRKLQQVVAKEILKQGTAALEKYKKSRRIVEEGVLYLRLKLEVEENEKPLFEVKIDDLILGYINEPVESKTPNNEAIFKVECYKRGDSRWDRHTIQVSPIKEYANYYDKGKKTARFAPTPDNPDEPVTVYIPIRWKRRFGLIKIRKPKIAKSSIKS